MHWQATPDASIDPLSGAVAAVTAPRTGASYESAAPIRNRLIGALSPAELARLRPHLEPVQLEQRTTLYDVDEVPIRYVYFPETCVVSLLNTLHRGGAVEVGTVGCEGMAGLPVFLSDNESPLRAIVQIPGMAARIEVEHFLRATAGGQLHVLLLRYTQAFLTQVAQTAACNAAHLVEERCARWLLTTHDRVEGDSFPLTHEFLAFMLGVRRAGVTVAMQALQDRHLVRYGRGWVSIVDRAGLEAASCECYATVHAHYERLLPRGG